MSKRRGTIKTAKIGNIELGKVLGCGGFGHVRLGLDTKSQRPVAVKVIDKQMVRRDGLESYVKREIEMLQTMRHRHIVRLVEVHESPTGYYIVMELATGGELAKKVKKGGLEENVARRYFQQVMSAIAHLHRMGVVHRDIKAENILLDGKNSDVKVCDFGLARFIVERGKDHPTVLSSLVGSVDYQAPEVIKTDGYTGYTCDVWSCGVVLFFLLTGYMPFTAPTEEETAERILSCKFNRNDKRLSPSARDLLSKMLVVDTSQRYTTKQVIEHEWFTTDLDPGLFDDSELFDMSHKHLRSNKQTERFLLQAFYSCNVHQTGFLHKQEMRDVFIKLNGDKAVESQKVDEFMELFHPETKGHVTETEFVQGWIDNAHELANYTSVVELVDVFHTKLDPRLLGRLRVAFNKIDADGDGIVSAKDLVATKIEQLDADEALKELLREAEAENVTFEHFCAAVSKHSDMLVRNRNLVLLLKSSVIFDAVDFARCSDVAATGRFDVSSSAEEVRSILSSSKNPEFSFEKSGNGGSFHFEGQHGMMLSKGNIEVVEFMEGFSRISLEFHRRDPTRQESHESKFFVTLRKMLESQVVQCAIDTCPSGEGEWL